MYAAWLTNGVETEEIGTIRAVTVVGIPGMTVITDVVLLEYQFSPTVIDTQPVGRIYLKFDILDVPYVIDSIAIGGYGIGEPQQNIYYVDNLQWTAG